MDVRNVVRQYGTTINILQQTDAQTTRDDYGSIIDRQNVPITVSAFPVEIDPSEKKLMALGINEMVNILVHLSKLDCDEQGLDFSEIDTILHTFEWLGIEYKIKTKRFFSQFNGEYLYIVLGGVRN